MTSRVSGRDSVAPPPSDRPVRDLLQFIYACTRDANVRPGVSPRPGSRVAPSLAMSHDATAERDSQPAQRDELAHSPTVPIGDGVLPLTIDTTPPATTETLESLHTTAGTILRSMAQCQCNSTVFYMWNAAHCQSCIARR